MKRDIQNEVHQFLKDIGIDSPDLRFSIHHEGHNGKTFLSIELLLCTDQDRTMTSHPELKGLARLKSAIYSKIGGSNE
jgi:hypothetical protein